MLALIGVQAYTLVAEEVLMSLDPADHTPRFASAQVCEAAGISHDTLKNWVSRKPQVVLMTNEEREQVGKGHPLLFSFNRAMQVALTAKIAAMGPTPREAALIAAGFTDISDGPLGNTPSRDPGELFGAGLTVLAWYPGEPIGRVMNVDPSDTRAYDLFWFDGKRDEVSAVIVNRLHARVRSALGLS
jgi:hypothetical protein